MTEPKSVHAQIEKSTAVEDHQMMFLSWFAAGAAAVPSRHHPGSRVFHEAAL